MGEVWLAIPGFDGYEASSLGRIRSVDRRLSDGRLAGGVILTATEDDNGYPRVTLSLDGRPRTVQVHQLVLLAFRGRCPRGKETRHLNGVRNDNRLSNLAYGTHSQNGLDKARHRRQKLSPGDLVRLSDAVALGVVSLSLTAIRKASHRDQGFPQAVARQGLSHLYRPADLREWERNRNETKGHS